MMDFICEDSVQWLITFLDGIPKHKDYWLACDLVVLFISVTFGIIIAGKVSKDELN